jgi:hypothetical protein
MRAPARTLPFPINEQDSENRQTKANLGQIFRWFAPDTILAGKSVTASRPAG